MRTIPLTRSKVALVDDEDYEELSAHKWNAFSRRRLFYAVRAAQRACGKRPMILMHRVVLSRKLGRPLVKGEDTDHINGDGLDNRRENLRSATRSQNLRNCRRHVTNLTSRYLDVNWYKRLAMWDARICTPDKRVSLGYYRSESEAALAREFFISAHPELQARSNFAGHELTL